MRHGWHEWKECRLIEAYYGKEHGLYHKCEVGIKSAADRVCSPGAMNHRTDKKDPIHHGNQDGNQHEWILAFTF